MRIKNEIILISPISCYRVHTLQSTITVFVLIKHYLRKLAMVLNTFNNNKFIEKLRKYSLDSCDLPTMFQNVGTLLRLVTVNIFKDNKERINILAYIFVFISLISYFYVYFFSVLWFVFVRTPKTRDWTTAVVEFSLAACSECSIVKIVYAIVFEKRIQTLVESYLKFDAMTPPGKRFTKNLRENLRNTKKRIMIIWTILSVNGILYVMRPLVTPGRHFPEDLFVVYGLEPMFESPNFEIASIMMYFSVIFSVYSLVNVIALVLITVGYTESQILALSAEIRHIWDDATNFAETKRHLSINTNVEELKNKYVKNQLAHIARFHIINIDLISKLEHTFRLSKAGEFLIGMCSIIAELLGGLENTYLQIPYSLALIFIDCVAGQRLINACGVFEDAVYSCKWEHFDIKNMKTVLIILQNAQKTLTLTAGGIAIMDYTCMVSFFKLCYSMYTTLRLVVN